MYTSSIILVILWAHWLWVSLGLDAPVDHTIVGRWGYSYTWASLEETISIMYRDPWSIPSCHTYAHTIGNRALEQYGFTGAMNLIGTREGDEFNNCIQWYLHGVVEEYISEELPLWVDAIELCATWKVSFLSIYERHCIHGIGHGYLLSTWRNVAHAIGYCDTLDTDLIREDCYSWVWMEYFWWEPYHAKQLSLGWNRDDPVAACIGFSNMSQRPYCLYYMYLARFRYAPKEGYEGILSVCRDDRLTTTDRGYCVMWMWRGLIGKMSDPQVQSLYDRMLTTERPYFLHGMIGTVRTNPSLYRTVRACVSHSWTSTCLAEVRRQKVSPYYIVP